MKTHERIRHLRKDLLKLTQDEFSKKINISRSNFANIEMGNINVTPRVIADICREFSINTEWLLKGTEPVFPGEITAAAYKIISLYKMLNEDNQRYLQGYVHRLLEEQNSTDKPKK